MSSWKCQDCGAVWAPDFIGPCTHPDVIGSATSDKAFQVHRHEYEGLDMIRRLRCRICGLTADTTMGSTGSNKVVI